MRSAEEPRSGDPWDSVASRAQWRAWLDAHHASATEAFVVIHKKGPRAGSITLADAQEEALCFGWVDVRNRRIDDERYMLQFAPRRAGSAWSSSNVERVERLTELGLMTPAGMSVVEEAKANGQWELALRVDQTDDVPAELEAALREHAGALEGYLGLSHSARRQILRSVLGARTEAGKRRRIDAAVADVTASLPAAKA